MAQKLNNTQAAAPYEFTGFEVIPFNTGKHMTIRADYRQGENLGSLFVRVEPGPISDGPTSEQFIAAFCKAVKSKKVKVSG